LKDPYRIELLTLLQRICQEPLIQDLKSKGFQDYKSRHPMPWDDAVIAAQQASRNRPLICIYQAVAEWLARERMQFSPVSTGQRPVPVKGPAAMSQ